METTTSKFSVLELGQSFVQENKTLFWGVIAPLIVGAVFWSLAAGLTVVTLASMMFAKNGKMNEAKQVWINAGAVILTIAFIIIMVGGLAGIAPRP